MLRKNIIVSMVFLVAVVPFAVASDSPEVKALKKDMPPDVSLLIDRIVGCNYWRAEEPSPSNKERVEKVNKALQELQCSVLEKDQAVLTIRYQNDYMVKARLQDAQFVLL
jgi:hypothetical protein